MVDNNADRSGAVGNRTVDDQWREAFASPAPGLTERDVSTANSSIRSQLDEMDHQAAKALIDTIYQEIDKATQQPNDADMPIPAGNPFVLVRRDRLLTIFRDTYLRAGYSSQQSLALGSRLLDTLIVAYPREE